MVQPGHLALYAERELPKRIGVPHRPFREPKRKVKCAEDICPQPVKPTRGYDPDVGSEGLVAQSTTELHRTDPSDSLPLTTYGLLPWRKLYGFEDQEYAGRLKAETVRKRK